VVTNPNLSNFSRILIIFNEKSRRIGKGIKRKIMSYMIMCIKSALSEKELPTRHV